MNNSIHVSDRDLLMAADGELDSLRTAEIHDHITVCAACGARSNKIRDGLNEISGVLRAQDGSNTEALQRARSHLRTQLAEASMSGAATSWWTHALYAGGACVLAVVLGLIIFQPHKPLGFFETDAEAQLLPNRALTPGLPSSLTKTEICDPAAAISRTIPAVVGQHIFDEYGIGDPRPGGFELDYLIDPELGGSDDPRNLWPQPYSAEWNARVKDALEDRLHQLVCTGQISLQAAQHDVSVNWISAYRKYFHTGKPIVSHMAFTKDKPWN